MLDKIMLPYTCFSQMTRFVQVEAFSAYEKRRVSIEPESADSLRLIKAVKPDLADKVSLFLTRNQLRLSPSLGQQNWLSRLIPSHKFKETDCIQAIRELVVDSEYMPWSNHYVYQWNDFFDWYNKIEFNQQCQVNDMFELITGKSLLVLTEKFSSEILAHVKSGQCFYPAPQYNEYLQCFDRPEIIINRFSVDTRKQESERSKKSKRHLFSRDIVFSDGYGNHDYYADSDYDSENQREVVPLRYKEIELPKCETDPKFQPSLEGSIRYAFEIKTNSEVDYTFNIKYEGQQIASLKNSSGKVSLISVEIPHDIPGILSKDLVIDRIHRIACEYGQPNILRSLLDEELGL